MIKIWDIALRIFHWLLVILFCLSAYSAMQDKAFGGYDTMHLLSGISILILVTSRIIWGFVGSSTALFKNFITNPRVLWAYVKNNGHDDSYQWIGHNPLGGWSTMLLLVGLALQACMGLFATDDMFFEGPLYGVVDESMSGSITAWHRKLGFTLIALAIIHVVAIAYYSVIKKANLLHPMITGYKVVQDNFIKKDREQPALKSAWFALLIFLIVGLIVCSLVFGTGG